MDICIKLARELFTQKRLVAEAMNLLNAQKEAQILKYEDLLFKPLERELQKIGLILCVHAHYEESRVSIYKKGAIFHEEITIENYKIKDSRENVSYVDRKREEAFREALGIVKEFLLKLDTEEVEGNSMNTDVRKISELYAEKGMIREAMSSLLHEKQEKIREYEELLFRPLEKELSNIGLILTIKPYYKESKVTIFGKYEIGIDIENYKIKDNREDLVCLDRKKEEAFREALGIVKEFLLKLDTE